MELFLNLVWLAVAFLVAAALCRRPVRIQGRVQWAILAVGITCVAALIFPAISMSDDVHFQYLMSESPDKRLQAAHSQLQTVAIAFVLFVLAACFIELYRRERLQFHARLLSGFDSVLVGRAPPAISR